MASTCASLAAEIAALRAEIARIPKVDENRIVQTTKAAIRPDISAAVAAGGVVITNQLKPQINDAFNKGREALEKAFKVETGVNNAQREALKATNEALRASRDNAALEGKIRRAQSTADTGVEIGTGATRSAGEAKRIGNNAFDQARKASNNAFTAERKAVNALDAAQLSAKESGLAKGLANQAKTTAGQAFSKATDAISDAAKATSTALNTASEVTGLKGVINGVKSTVGRLGSAIASVEKSVGSALTKAAEAIGISQKALAATGKLAGQVLQIFNIIGTIFTILDGLATRELLGARIDALENGLDRLGNEISKVLGNILTLTIRVRRNEGSISEVRNIAVDARLIGEAANRAAGSAQITAARAEGFATTGIAKANQAQLTADGAVRNAKQANDNATTAYKKAVGAESIAEQAKRLGGQALGKAGEALNTALVAIALYQTFKGLRGLKGDPGIPGRQGAPGRNGAPGRDGAPGRNGAPGLSGFGRPGRDGINGINGINGKDGKDVNPAEAASLRALIIQQHTQTRLNSTIQHSTTRTTILTPIMAALAPILALLKQIYDAVMAVSNAAILALLNIVNTKLGVQLVGGISGKLTRFSQWLQLDRALNVLIFAATVHNALMLSNDIGQTLVSAVNNILQVFGLKNDEGEVFSLSSSIQSIIQAAIGAENYTILSESWAKANRIYQATTNVLNSFLNLSQTILQASELIAAYTGKIGNALRKGGVILESAYGWMNPQPKFNRVTQTLESLQNGANTIQMVTQAPLDVANAVTESTTAATEFVKAVKEDENPINKATPIPEPDELKAKEIQSKANSQPFIFDFSDLFDGED